MKPALADLVRLRGRIDRGTYAFWGVLLAVVKYNLDRILVAVETKKAFYPIAYWMPGDLFGVLSPQPDAGYSAKVLSLLVGVALPFVACGILLTVQRARDAGLPVGSVLLFFVPVVNLLFFAMLCVLPSQPEPGTPPLLRRPRSFLDHVLPEGAFGSAAVTMVLLLPLSAGLTWLGTSWLRTYAWGLFLGLPFFHGLASAALYGYRRPRSLGACIGVAMISTVLLAGALIAVAVEGLICILMATPIAAALALLGALIGWAIQMRPFGGRDAGTVVPSLALLLPALLGIERAAQPEPPLREVATCVLVDAPPARVWQHVVAFAELPPPRELLFRAGIAYPLRAEIDGAGPGAVRHCVFSTGAFVEPIEAWDEPRRLEFRVAAQPPSMREMTPYPAIAPAHLENFLVSKRGRFRLEATPDGRTRLEGTTWYTNRMWPASYWAIFSDEIIHRIHLRVLEHIRARAESGRG